MTAKITADASGTKVTIGTAAEDALQIDATAKTIKALAPYTLVPTPQTWQDLTASRALGVTYPNDTGQQIQVAVTCTGVNLNEAVVASLPNGHVIYGSACPSAGGSSSILFNMPAGGYTLGISVGPGALFGWKELRP